MNLILKIELPMSTPSKKNSQNIVYNHKTKKPVIIQNERYLNFERDCAVFLSKYKININTPINLKCTFIVPNRIRRDLTNLLNAIQDVLVKYKVLADDNFNIVQSVDGSRIICEKGVEKTIIEISEVESEK